MSQDDNLNNSQEPSLQELWYIPNSAHLTPQQEIHYHNIEHRRNAEREEKYLLLRYNKCIIL